MGVNLYLSTDASAPSLTGQTGSLVALLDAILVNGYGSKSAAGWTIAYTGTSKRDYKQGSGSNGYYLDVDDSGPGAGSYREARMRGYEAMTALGTGTQAFPTTAQSSFGVVCRKSTTADSTARNWYCVADSTCLYLFVDTGDYTNPNYAMGFMFGDFFSYRPSDIYNTMIVGRNGENSNSYQQDWFAALNNASTVFSTISGHFLDRAYTGVGGSAPCGKFGSMLNGAFSSWAMSGSSNATVPYPNAPDGAMELSPMYVVQGGYIRGYMKGLWAVCHNQPFGHGDTFNGGSANMSGKSFLGMWQYSYINAATPGCVAVETSNTWS